MSGKRGTGLGAGPWDFWGLPFLSSSFPAQAHGGWGMGGREAVGGLCAWLGPDPSDAGPEKGAAERSEYVG